MMKYFIYQTDPEFCNYTFGWWNLSKDIFDFNDYNLVYEGEIEVDPRDIEITLDNLFRIFNSDRPKDFKGHSLSVSDLVEIGNRFYYCDSLGWVDITEYVR